MSARNEVTVTKYQSSVPQKIPKRVSDHIIRFYMDHRQLLVQNTSSRGLTANAERGELYRRLIHELDTEFGVLLDVKKIKNHYEHYRSRVFSKSGKMSSGAARETRYRMGTGGGFSRREERVDLARFRVKDTVEWLVDDVVSWMLDVAKRHGIPFEEMNMHTECVNYGGPMREAMAEILMDRNSIWNLAGGTLMMHCL